MESQQVYELLMQKQAGERYPNPPFREEKFEGLYQKWKIAVGEDTLLEEGITEEAMQWTCETICTEFPRGEGCGSLLWEPVVDDTPLERRGVSLEWLTHVWCWMRNILNSEGPILSTRLFVALFVEPLVAPPAHDHEQGHAATRAIPLYYFVPVQFRGRPQVFLSHGWDSWLRHLLYLPPSSEPGQIAAKEGSQKTFLWLDIFAIVQDPGSGKQQSQVARIGEVIQSIGNTCIVVPGHGSINFALLPARRSWCCLEIAYTQQLSARVGLNKAFFAPNTTYDYNKNNKFHQSLVHEICQLKCTGAETSDENEKKAIQKLLDQELGMEQADYLVRKAILQAFYERYQTEKYSSRASHIAKMYRHALESHKEVYEAQSIAQNRQKKKKRKSQVVTPLEIDDKNENSQEEESQLGKNKLAREEERNSNRFQSENL